MSIIDVKREVESCHVINFPFCSNWFVYKIHFIVELLNLLSSQPLIPFLNRRRMINVWGISYLRHARPERESAEQLLCCKKLKKRGIKGVVAGRIGNPQSHWLFIYIPLSGDCSVNSFKFKLIVLVLLHLLCAPTQQHFSPENLPIINVDKLSKKAFARREREKDEQFKEHEKLLSEEINGTRSS